MADSPDCIFKFDPWQGVAGHVVLLLCYNVALIIHIFAITVTVIKKNLRFMNKLFIVYLAGNIILLLNYTVASCRFLTLTEPSKPCMERKVSYFTNQLGTTISIVALNVITITHFKQLRSVAVINTSEDKRKLYRFSLIQGGILLTISIIFITLPVAFNLTQLIAVIVWYQVILNFISVYYCYRSYKLPCWDLSTNANMAYLMSIKSNEMLILATTCLTLCPQILNIVIHVIIYRLNLTASTRIILMWIGRLNVIGLIFKAIVYLWLHPSMKRTISPVS